MAANESDRRHRNAVAETGRLVGVNLRRLRDLRRWSTNDLAQQLGEKGRPIPPTGITRIESGNRAVDVDDLMTLATVLRVNPNALLFPPVADDTMIALTAAGVIPAWVVWQWADGRAPLAIRADEEKAQFEPGALTDFFAHARPTGLPKDAETLAALNDLKLRASRLIEGLQHRQRGTVDPIVKGVGADPAEDLARRAEAVRRAMRRLEAEVDDLLAEAEDS